MAMNFLSFVRTALVLPGLLMCATTALPSQASDHLLRAALARLGQQGSDMASHESKLLAQTQDGLRRIDNALPSNNPLKGQFGGASGGLAQQLGGGAVTVPTAAGSAGASALAAGDCPKSLRHVAAKLPRYNDAELDAVRDMVLDMDLMDAFRQGRAMGYSSSKVASLSLQQAREAEEYHRSARQCLEGFHTNPQEAARSLENGTYPFGTGYSNSSACAKSVVLSHYQKVANQEAAVAMACIARSNP
jgi:hypothetical protein